jgi:hypothetical protein
MPEYASLIIAGVSAAKAGINLYREKKAANPDTKSDEPTNISDTAEGMAQLRRDALQVWKDQVTGGLGLTGNTAYATLRSMGYTHTDNIKAALDQTLSQAKAFREKLKAERAAAFAAKQAAMAAAPSPTFLGIPLAPAAAVPGAPAPRPSFALPIIIIAGIAGLIFFLKK